MARGAHVSVTGKVKFFNEAKGFPYVPPPQMAV